MRKQQQHVYHSYYATIITTLVMLLLSDMVKQCDGWAMTFYQDFCKTPVALTPEGKMQLGISINATKATNANTLAADRCEQFCESIGAVWKNADERDNWATQKPYGCYTWKRDSTLGLEETCWFNDLPVADPPPPERACKTKWWPIEKLDPKGKKSPGEACQKNDECASDMCVAKVCGIVPQTVCIEQGYIVAKPWWEQPWGSGWTCVDGDKDLLNQMRKTYTGTDKLKAAADTGYIFADPFNPENKKCCEPEDEAPNKEIWDAASSKVNGENKVMPGSLPGEFINVCYEYYKRRNADILVSNSFDIFNNFNEKIECSSDSQCASKFNKASCSAAEDCVQVCLGEMTKKCVNKKKVPCTSNSQCGTNQKCDSKTKVCVKTEYYDPVRMPCGKYALPKIVSATDSKYGETKYVAPTTADDFVSTRCDTAIFMEKYRNLTCCENAHHSTCKRMIKEYAFRCETAELQLNDGGLQKKTVLNWYNEKKCCESPDIIPAHLQTNYQGDLHDFTNGNPEEGLRADTNEKTKRNGHICAKLKVAYGNFPNASCIDNVRPSIKQITDKCKPIANLNADKLPWGVVEGAPCGMIKEGSPETAVVEVARPTMCSRTAEGVKLQCVERAKYSAGDEATMKYAGQYICVDHSKAPKDTPLVKEDTLSAAVNCVGYLALTVDAIKGKLQDPDPARYSCNRDYLKRNGVAIDNPYNLKRSAPLNGFLTAFYSAAAIGGASLHCVSGIDDPKDPKKKIGAYAMTAWAPPTDTKKCSGEHVQQQEAAGKKVGAARGPKDYEILFPRLEDDKGKPLCVPVAYDSKGSPILRVKIDCDTPSNEVGMGGALFVMMAIGLAFGIHQKFKAAKEKALMAGVDSKKKKNPARRPAKRPARKPGAKKGFFGKKKDAKVQPTDKDAKKDDESTDKKDGDDVEKLDIVTEDKKDTEEGDIEKDNGDVDLNEGDDDKKNKDSDVDIEIDDSDNEKEDEKKEAEAVVDLSMGANLVSPTTTKKKKLNKGAAVF